MINAKKCIALTFALASLLVGSLHAEEEAKKATLKGSRPNIVFVLTDDQGYGDLACLGHPWVKTPNMDKIHEQSTRFTSFYVSPTCAPTRAALMSGKRPFKVGVTHTISERERMSLEATTIAEVLKKAGYTTGIFGKWHLGDQAPYQPEKRGFDEVFIHGAGGIGQNYGGSCADAPGNSYFNPVIRHNGTFVKTEGYCTDVFFKQALGWIKANKDKDKPFFAYIPANAPHLPFKAPKEYVKMYMDMRKGKKASSFYGMITNIDDNLGILMEKLDTWGLTENTLLIFMTDNGTTLFKVPYNTAGMVGRKNTITEGGSRVPAFFRWPGKIEAGRDVDALTRHVDIFPTLAELAGAEDLPDDLDGRSMVPLLSDPSADWPSRYMFFHLGRWTERKAKTSGEGEIPDQYKYLHFAVRHDKWRLIGKKELYAIKQGHRVSRNVIDEHPEVVKSMLAAYDKWWEDVRPCMINENVTKPEEPPYHVWYKQQKETMGIPAWKEPSLE
jgi:arylsulfatase